MRQQVEVTVKITLDVDANLTKEELRKEIERDINIVLSKKGVLDCVMLGETEIVDLKEETEIYQTEILTWNHKTEISNFNDMKLITTNEYLFLIDKEAEIKGKGWRVDLKRNSLGVIDDDLYYNKVENKNNFALVKAYYPLILEAKELDLPLLPNPFEDISYDELEIKYYQELEEKRLSAINFKGQVAGRHPDNLSSREIHAKVSGFIEGHKAAQPKQFSLEDMINAFNMGQSTYKESFLHKNAEERRKETKERFIKSLSTQQLPFEFIPEYINTNSFGSETNGYDSGNFILKTTVNSGGKKVLCGTYKY